MMWPLNSYQLILILDAALILVLLTHEFDLARIHDFNNIFPVFLDRVMNSSIDTIWAVIFSRIRGEVLIFYRIILRCLTKWEISHVFWSNEILLIGALWNFLAIKLLITLNRLQTEIIFIRLLFHKIQFPGSNGTLSDVHALFLLELRYPLGLFPALFIFISLSMCLKLFSGKGSKNFFNIS